MTQQEEKTLNADEHAAQPTLTHVVSPGENEEEDEAPTMPIGDLPNASISEADRKLMEVYGGYIHQNDGSHLDGDIKEDSVWQSRWRKLVALPCQRYNAPGGAVGRRFMRLLTEELNGIRKRKWKSERFIVF